MCVLLRGAGVTVSNLEGALHTTGWAWGLEEEKKRVNKKQRKKRVFMAERRRETLCGEREGERGQCLFSGQVRILYLSCFWRVNRGRKEEALDIKFKFARDIPEVERGNGVSPLF